jgi:hypothetical protein
MAGAHEFERCAASGAHTAGVHARHNLSPSLIELARVQAGVLSRQQLLAEGLSSRVIKRMLGMGLLTPFERGYYCRAGSVDWPGRAWAGLLMGGSAAVLGMDAAAHLHGLINAAPDEITVFAPTPVAARPGWRFLRSTRSGTGEPARTSIAATVVDLCAERDEDAIAALVADAISSRKTTAQDLIAEIDSRPRLTKRRLLREVLGDVRSGAHSALERRYLVHVERAHGLPEAQRQRRVHADHRSDAYYEYGLLVELDGRAHHRGAAVFHDMLRDNDHSAMGVVTLRLGWAHVVGTAQCETAAFIGSLLMSRGWAGPLQTCQRCRLVHQV